MNHVALTGPAPQLPLSDARAVISTSPVHQDEVSDERSEKLPIPDVAPNQRPGAFRQIAAAVAFGGFSMAVGLALSTALLVYVLSPLRMPGADLEQISAFRGLLSLQWRFGLLMGGVLSAVLAAVFFIFFKADFRRAVRPESQSIRRI
jgi:hypothetical protein